MPIWLKIVIAALFVMQGAYFISRAIDSIYFINGWLRTATYLPLESKRHFAKLEQELSAAAERRQLDLHCIRNDFDEGGVVKDYRIDLDEDTHIFISMYNIAYERKTGTERFRVRYLKRDRERAFDSALFCELVNSISAYQLDVAFCDEFLQDLDGKVSESYLGTDYAAGWLCKYCALDVYEDWILTEDLLVDESQQFQYTAEDFAEYEDYIDYLKYEKGTDSLEIEGYTTYGYVPLE